MKRGRILRANWESGRSFNKEKTVELVTKAFEDNPTVTVTSVVTKDKKQGRPIPLNTVNLLKACSKALGIGPHAAMQGYHQIDSGLVQFFNKSFISSSRTSIEWMSCLVPPFRSLKMSGKLLLDAGFQDAICNLLKAHHHVCITSIRKLCILFQQGVLSSNGRDVNALWKGVALN